MCRIICDALARTGETSICDMVIAKFVHAEAAFLGTAETHFCNAAAIH